MVVDLGMRSECADDEEMDSLRETLRGYALNEVWRVEVASMPLPQRGNERVLDVGEPPFHSKVNLDNF